MSVNLYSEQHRGVQVAASENVKIFQLLKSSCLIKSHPSWARHQVYILVFFPGKCRDRVDNTLCYTLSLEFWMHCQSSHVYSQLAHRVN